MILVFSFGDANPLINIGLRGFRRENTAGCFDRLVWPIDRPQPYPGNPDKIPAEAVDTVATSIRHFGFRQPIVVEAAGLPACRSPALQ